jgi:hypothetical protein
MISAMLRLVRGTPVVRGIATAMAAVIVLCGAVPLLAYPLLRLDAAGYETAIGSAAKECSGDPIPARGGCWSAAPARVTVSGADVQRGVSFVVVDVPGQPGTREDFVTPPPNPIAVGATLTARYWHDTIAVLMLPGADRSKPPLALPTRDNPSYRVTSLPVGGALLFLAGGAGLLTWGLPLLDDVRRYRERRRHAAAAEIAVRDSTSSPTFGRGLARYGFDVGGAPEDVVLTGRRADTEETPATPTARATKSQPG